MGRAAARDFPAAGRLPAPLSVDVLVWPSLFDTGQGLGLPAEQRRRLGLAGIPAPAWTGPNAGLWEDLEHMLGYLAAGAGAAARLTAQVVAVTWLAEDGFRAAGPVGPYPPAPRPGQMAAGWQFLGYDVGDGGLLSGLLNCGYRAGEAPGLRRAWAPRLNERHLFDDPAQALRFSRLAGDRVPEHAPFFVYGLYRVQ